MVDRSEHAARTQRDATSRSAASPRTSLDTPTPRTPARQPLLEGRSGEWHAAGRSTAASRVRRDRLALCLAGRREVSVECPSDSARWRDSMRDAERRIRCDTRDSRQSPWSGAGPILHGMQEVRGSNPLSSTLFIPGPTSPPAAANRRRSALLPRWGPNPIGAVPRRIPAPPQSARRDVIVFTGRCT